MDYENGSAIKIFDSMEITQCTKSINRKYVHFLGKFLTHNNTWVKTGINNNTWVNTGAIRSILEKHGCMYSMP